MTAQAGGDPVPGALADLRIVELSSERGAFAAQIGIRAAVAVVARSGFWR